MDRKNTVVLVGELPIETVKTAVCACLDVKNLKKYMEESQTITNFICFFK